MGAPAGVVESAERVPGRSALAAVGLWLALAAVLASAGYWTASVLAGSDAEAPTLTAVLLAYLLLPIAALVVFRADGLRRRLAVRPPGRRSYGTAVVVWAATLAASTVVYLIIGAIGGNLDGPLLDLIHDATDYSRFSTATGLDWLLIVPRALLLAGVTEELLFRGIFFGWLRSRLPWWSTALVTAVVFAAIHYYLVLIPIALMLGIALAWLREHTESILPGLLVHILTDTLLFAIALTIR